MCNLYANTMPVDAMREIFDVPSPRTHLGNAEPLRAIFPRHEAPIVRIGAEGRELVRAHWGFLMPQISKKTGKPILPKAINNTRDDKVRISRFWRKSFEVRRCLIPATAFCEAKGRKPATYHWFSVGGSGQAEPFAFAGVWRSFRGTYRDEKVEVDTYSMMTSTPNDLVRKIHPDRMPVILGTEAQATWLEGSVDEAFEVIETYPADRMQEIGEGEEMKSQP
ncbi:SOS response-associated peptidase [Limimaricola soesokkakensis]|uniref:SOS response-associated peptidase n=1 Tax=Limimaricola soesokkakensis TaxID=1343159 RepID=UPI003515B6C2